jgi:hypothetical protein
LPGQFRTEDLSFSKQPRPKAGAKRTRAIKTTISIALAFCGAAGSRGRLDLCKGRSIPGNPAGESSNPAQADGLWAKKGEAKGKAAQAGAPIEPEYRWQCMEGPWADTGIQSLPNHLDWMNGHHPPK